MVCCHKCRQLVFHHFTIENFSFEDKYEYEIKLKVFARVLQEKRTPQKASFYCFHLKLWDSYLYWRSLSPLLLAKWWNFLHLITGSRLYYILAKTRCSSMTMTTMFSRKNDAGSRLNNTQYWENLVLKVILISESKAL